MVIVLLLLLPIQVFAQDFMNAYKMKDWNRITETYAANQEKAYSDKELVVISYALRKRGFYRQDIKLNVRLVKTKYLEQHKKLVQQIKDGDTVDPEAYPEGLKITYWNLLQDYARIIEGYTTISQLTHNDHKHFVQYNKMISDLEFREKQADKLADKLVNHIQDLQERVYVFKSSLTFQYMSWQQYSTLTGPNGDSNLIVTNRGYCIGGDAGYENRYYHWYVDGCFLYGVGSVKGEDSIPVYQQSDVSAMGFKIGPGVSRLVSASKSRIGLRLPIIGNFQKLSQPASSAFSIEEKSAISVAVSLYSRWQFDKWYVQTEFGKYVTADASIWGLGIGRNF
jgi:hypothetical protein